MGAARGAPGAVRGPPPRLARGEGSRGPTGGGEAVEDQAEGVGHRAQRDENRRPEGRAGGDQDGGGGGRRLEQPGSHPDEESRGEEADKEEGRQAGDAGGLLAPALSEQTSRAHERGARTKALEGEDRDGEEAHQGPAGPQQPSGDPLAGVPGHELAQRVQDGADPGGQQGPPGDRADSRAATARPSRIECGRPSMLRHTIAMNATPKKPLKNQPA